MMANSTKILEVCQVVPSSDSSESATEFSLPLTFFDTFWFKLPPLQCILFNNFTDSTPTFFNSVILPRLKSSLSQTLLHFPPLAGHLIWPSHSPKPIIHYSPDNAAISLTIAESNADFDKITGNYIREAGELLPYIPELTISDTMASIIALQITLFPSKGFCIGITAHHAVVDGNSMFMFFKAWAYICRNNQKEKKLFPDLLPEITPLFDRTIIKDPTGLDLLYLNHWISKTTLDSESNSKSLKLLPNLRGVRPNLVRATFQLTHDLIKKIRKMVQLYHPLKNLHLSTFVLIYAYVLVCLVKTRGGDGKRKVYVSFPVDCRNRLEPQIPVNYFGNCVCIHDMVVEAEAFMEEDGVAVIAEKLRDLIKGLEKGVIEEANENKLAKIRALGPEVQKFGLAGSPSRFKCYGLDFGWGRPKKVEIVSIERTNAIALMDSRDENGGVEIGVVLLRQEMEIFSSLFLQCIS